MKDLFDKPVARRTDPETSHAAARDVTLTASADRLLVLQILSTRSITDFELAAITGRQQTSIGKRRGECKQHDLVREARDGRGEIVKRPAPSGSAAMV